MAKKKKEEDEDDSAERLAALNDAFEVDDEKSDMEKVLEHLMDPNKIMHNTQLTRDEIIGLNGLAVIGKRNNLDIITQWLSGFMQMKVSEGRQGRKEVVKITSRAVGMDMDNNQRPKWWQFGRQ